MVEQYKFILLILLMTFLINLITFQDFEKEISAKRFLKMFFVRADDEAENIRLYIFQISFWMLVPVLFLVNVANR